MYLAAEDELLIRCSRTSVPEEARASATNLLQAKLDWQYIVESSIAHNVAPLFYKGLMQLNDAGDCIPLNVRQELQGLYEGNALRNRRLFAVIAEVAKSLERAGIPALGLKDIQLAPEVYGDIALRPIGDIDILVHRHDYARAADCLGELGFLPRAGAEALFTRKYAWAEHFQRSSDNIWIDLQWNVIQREWDQYGEGNFDFEIDRMWQNAKPMDVEGSSLLVPSPEDMLFHLCLHLEGHAFGELILFCDIVELIEHYGAKLDWGYLVAITKKYRAESSVYYVLLLIERLFQVELPAHLLQELAPQFLNAALFEPLYDNLTLLHVSLDEIRAQARPPVKTLEKFEKSVRQQAFAAMQAYRELEGLAIGIQAHGGKCALYDGNPSERVFPDTTIPAFRELRLLLLDEDLPMLPDALRARGFQASNDLAFIKEWQVPSADPALANTITPMRVQVRVQQELGSIIKLMQKPGLSKKDAALKSLKSRLIKTDGSGFQLQIDVLALPPEELVMILAERAGRRQQGWLLHLCKLIELFRHLHQPLNWDRLVALCAEYGNGSSVAEALLVLGRILGTSQIPDFAADQISPGVVPPHIFEAARYDVDSWGRYGRFKPLFFFVFSLLSTDGLGAQLEYLAGSLFRPSGRLPVLPGLLAELVTRSLKSMRPRQKTTRDFAYWIQVPGLSREHLNS